MLKCTHCGHETTETDWHRREICKGCGNTDDDAMEWVDDVTETKDPEPVV